MVRNNGLRYNHRERLIQLFRDMELHFTVLVCIRDIGVADQLEDLAAVTTTKIQNELYLIRECIDLLGALGSTMASIAYGRLLKLFVLVTKRSSQILLQEKAAASLALSIVDFTQIREPLTQAHVDNCLSLVFVACQLLYRIAPQSRSN